MTVFPSSSFDREIITQLADLFTAGAQLADQMLSATEPVLFEDWAAKLHADPKFNHTAVNRERLVWIWEMLRTDDELKLRFGDLPAATSHISQNSQPIKVFNQDEWFVIGFDNGSVCAILQHQEKAPWEELVSVLILQDLYMRPGKADHLECCDCKAEVIIRVGETSSIDREADLMCVEPERIKLNGRLIRVIVDSLNQAYTVASRRLEPNRRSHGGRTYGHVVHVGAEKRQRLEQIRNQVEQGIWKVPAAQAR